MGSSGAFKAHVSIKRKDTSSDSTLLSVSNDIYYERDNTASSAFKVTKEFIESLSPGDEIKLSANGRDENCGYGESEDYDE